MKQRRTSVVTASLCGGRRCSSGRILGGLEGGGDEGQKQLATTTPVRSVFRSDAIIIITSSCDINVQQFDFAAFIVNQSYPSIQDLVGHLPI